MKDPVDHILRPRLPWRITDEGAVTECGYDASKVKTLTREEFFSRVKDLGKTRTAMLTCLTCSETASRWGTWEEDPIMALQREIEWERGGRYSFRNENRGQRLRDELLAINILIDMHRGEFEAEISAIESRREWVRRKSS